MVPSDELLPPVRTDGRIRTDGTPSPELRAELRHISDVRSAVTVAGAWVQSLGLLWATAWIVGRTGLWVLWVPAFLLMGRAHALFGIVGHEAAHRLDRKSTRLNSSHVAISYAVFCLKKKT